MSVTVVAEIGQNHQGAIQLAKDMVLAAANPDSHDRRVTDAEGVDAIKTCKRDLDAELSRQQANQPYEGRQSFGPTYREHREALELSWDEHHELYRFTKAQGLDFIITLCGPSLVEECPFTPDAWKVASRDLTNVPLLRELARTNVPIYLSTGMHGPEALGEALEEIERHGGTVGCIMHCLSQYPAEWDAVNLNSIRWLRKQYPCRTIGYSDHTRGIVAGPVAVALGAEVIEKHVSIYRGMRGSDHEPAIDPSGLYRFVRDIRHTERMLGEIDMYAPEAAEAARQKLARSLAAGREMEAGTVVGSSDLILVSPDDGLDWSERDAVVGKELVEDVASNVLLSSTMVR